MLPQTFSTIVTFPPAATTPKQPEKQALEEDDAMRVDTRFWRICAPLMAVLAALPAAAQEETPEEFGTAGLTITTIGGASFFPESSGGFYADIGSLRASNGTATLRAAVSLPSGVSVERISLLGCDFDNVNDVTATLFRCPANGNGCVVAMATVNSSVGGCGPFEATPTPFTIDNNGQYYWIRVEHTNGFDASLGAVRLHWRRQVSPAPQNATFSDVPTTHVFFRFIEALVASGITSGCAPGQFCPAQPVTRGQMAAFLAIALGLHTPN